MVNDNMEPYRPPEYERVLINVFQIFNYLQIGDLNEAIVEARDLDSRFPVIEGARPQGGRFEDNGFARLLTGILYEAAGTGDDQAEALIAYRQAVTVYDAYYAGAYVPKVLKEGIRRLESSPRRDMAVVYLFESAGFSPVKEPVSVPVPVGDGLLTKVELPRFVDRAPPVQASCLVLNGPAGEYWSADVQMGVDVGDLARRDLESRKALVMAKAVARPGLKYLVERNQKDVIEKRSGPAAAGVFGFLSSIYNIVTERADLRSWQALPGEVRVARIEVPAGSYRMSVEKTGGMGSSAVRQDNTPVQLNAGRTYFLIRRTVP
jgi:hypothetical protein